MKSEDDSKAMPPPPHPILLEQEMESLRRCLQVSFVDDILRLAKPTDS